MNYFMVGMFVLLSIVVLMVALYNITGRSANVDYYYVDMKNVSGVRDGSPVTYAGYEIGQITGIQPVRDNGHTHYRMEIIVKARVGEKDRLYGSVTGADIATELGNVTGLVVDKRKIELQEPIRHVGTHNATVRFTAEITAEIKVKVEGERVAEEKEESRPWVKTGS